MSSNNNKFFKSQRDVSAKIAQQLSKPIWQELDNQKEEPSQSRGCEHEDENLNNDDFRYNNENNNVNDEPHSEADDSSDSGLSGFDSPLSVSMDDLRNKFFICEFEPIVRSSTPLPESDISHNSIPEDNLCKSSATNLWEKAMEENPALSQWIQSFNEELEMVEKSELIIKNN